MAANDSVQIYTPTSAEPETPPTNNPAAEIEGKAVAQGAYACCLVAPLLWFTPVIALILAYVYRDDSTPLVQGHYRFLRRTVWTGIIGGLAVALISMIKIVMFMVGIEEADTSNWVVLGIGKAGLALVMLALTVWFYARAVTGLVRLSKDAPIEKPTTWLL